MGAFDRIEFDLPHSGEDEQEFDIWRSLYVGFLLFYGKKLPGFFRFYRISAPILPKKPVTTGLCGGEGGLDTI